VEELFDPKRQDSAVGRIASMLGTYFDGDASRLATMLDPMRTGSPLSSFRAEVNAGFKAIEERLVAFQAGQTARAEERAKSAAKGADFEDVLEQLLGDICRGHNDLLERCGTESGDAGRSKKGDFVLTLDSYVCRGAEVRVVIEAKDRRMSVRDMREELRAAKTNRDAAAALVVFTPQHAPAGIAPFDVRAGDVYAVIDPADPDPAILEAAVRLARLLALASLRENEADVHPRDPRGHSWPQGAANEHRQHLGERLEGSGQAPRVRPCVDRQGRAGARRTGHVTASGRQASDRRAGTSTNGGWCAQVRRRMVCA
jgi:hypothetical protein